MKYQGKALSKSLKPIANLHIREFIERVCPERLDGEIISGPPNLSQETYNNTFRAVSTIKGEPEFKLYVFDYADENSGTTEERLKTLAAITKDLPNVVLVEQVVVNSMQEVEDLYQKFLEEGYEGMILRSPDGRYKYGRCTAKERTQVKLKPEEDFDAEVLDLYEAMHNGNEAVTNALGEPERSTHAENLTGKDMLGGLVVKDLETGVLTRVAAGKMKHEERVRVWKEYLADPKGFVKDKYIKYRSMTYGVLKDGAPRHGRFYAWRDASEIGKGF